MSENKDKLTTEERAIIDSIDFEKIAAEAKEKVRKDVGKSVGKKFRRGGTISLFIGIFLIVGGVLSLDAGVGIFLLIAGAFVIIYGIWAFSFAKKTFKKFTQGS